MEGMKVTYNPQQIVPKTEVSWLLILCYVYIVLSLKRK